MQFDSAWIQTQNMSHNINKRAPNSLSHPVYLNDWLENFFFKPTKTITHDQMTYALWSSWTSEGHFFFKQRSALHYWLHSSCRQSQPIALFFITFMGIHFSIYMGYCQIWRSEWGSVILLNLLAAPLCKGVIAWRKVYHLLQKYRYHWSYILVLYKFWFDVLFHSI